jgi:hypothetical protein
MSITFKQIRDKQKADAAEEAARLERRRGYDRAGRERRKHAKAVAESGLDDLPSDVAVAIEETLAAQESTPRPLPPTPPDATVDELVGRLEKIKDRIFRLQAVFAVSLSLECAVEADRYLAIFQELAAELEKKDASALENVVRGHEAILHASPVHVRQRIPIELQRQCELRWEVNTSPRRSTPKRDSDALPDGLGWML